MKKLALAYPLGLDEVARRAASLGWLFEEEFPADAECPYEAVWSVPTAGAQVHYIEDYIAGSAWFAFDADTSSNLEHLLVEHFVGRTLEQALDSAQQAADPADQINAAAMLAVLGPDNADPRCFAALVRLMQAPDAQVRLRSIVAAASLAWPEFIPVLSEIASQDPEDFVRWRATDTLEAFARVAAKNRPF